MPNIVKHIHCIHCQKPLRRDDEGQYCPTPGCLWNGGLPLEEDTATVRNRYFTNNQKRKIREDYE